MIDELEVRTLLEHIVAIRTDRLHARLWSLTAAAYPHLEKQDRQGLLQQVQAEAATGTRRKSALELVGDSDRIVMIGGNLKQANAAAWTARNGRWLDWLQARGVSPEQAMERHAAWQARELEHEFWQSSGSGIGLKAGSVS